jgi:hypothetical protein
VVVIPAKALRPHTTAWILDDNDTLAVQRLAVLARDSRMVVVAEGLEPGHRVILSHIARPLEGMSLVAAESDEAASGGEGL